GADEVFGQDEGRGGGGMVGFHRGGHDRARRDRRDDGSVQRCIRTWIPAVLKQSIGCGIARRRELAWPSLRPLTLRQRAFTRTLTNKNNAIQQMKRCASKEARAPGDANECRVNPTTLW